MNEAPITATEIIHNQIRDNLHLRIMPPIFQTPLERQEVQRLNQTLRQSVKNGPTGKFFCWHDYTYIMNAIPETVHEAEENVKYLYGCIKCGRQKKMKNLQIERVLY